MDIEIGNAEVYAFSAMNRDRYDGFSVEDIETQQLVAVLPK